MPFVINPNLPKGRTSLVVVDGRIGAEAVAALEQSGTSVLKLEPHSGLYTAVCGHPDLQLHHVGGAVIVHAPGTDPALLAELSSYGFELVRGESVLTPAYPRDIAYNVARVGSKYFHNLKYTDPILKKMLEESGVEPVHVEQGYTKCSLLAVDEHSIITSDIGIAKSAEKNGFDVLLVDYERNIQLPGLNYGFIGGAGGLLGERLLALNGAVRKLSCCEALLNFLSMKKIELANLSGSAVTDIGSILPLMVK
jgi:hypothetical protein